MNYDLTVIGGGPAGYVAAIRAAQLGMSVALVERSRMGGTCLNCGCIPTKTYYQQASLLRTLHHLNAFNIELDVDSIRFDFVAAGARKDQMITDLSAGISGLLKSNGIQTFNATATIVSPGEVSLTSNDGTPLDRLESKKILIATGSQCGRLPVPGADLPGILDSTSALALTKLPEQLVIIGGGVIGVEFASIFNAFGCHVSVIEATDRILPLIDAEVAKRMTVYLKKQGIALSTATFLQSIARTDSNGYELRLKDAKKESVVQADAVLIAVGRRPETESLGLDTLGIETQKGFIQVNQDYQTNIQGIYAVGDVTGRVMLAHVASEEARVAVERMAGIPSEVAYYAIPSCVFSFPEIASVGLTMEEAQRQGLSVRTGKFLFAANGKAKTIGEIDGFVKVIADSSDTIRGIHFIGPHASDLIAEASVIVQKKMSLDDALEVIHPHPTLCEVLPEAMMDVRQQAIHVLKR